MNGYTYKFVEINYDSESSTILNLDNVVIEEDEEGNVSIMGDRSVLFSLNRRSIKAIKYEANEQVYYLKTGAEIRLMNEMD